MTKVDAGKTMVFWSYIGDPDDGEGDKAMKSS